MVVTEQFYNELKSLAEKYYGHEKDHSDSTIYCGLCNIIDRYKMLDEFLKYLPMEVIETTHNGFRLLGKYDVTVHNRWKIAGKNKCYRFSTPRDFLKKYVSISLVTG